MKKRTESEMILRVFSGDDGKELLAYWDETLNQMPSYHSGQTPEDTAYNEGLRSFYLTLRNTLIEAKKNHE